MLYDIQQFSFFYPNTDTPALRNVNLQIEEGGFYVLMGASGSGKTTLLRQLKPVIAPHGVKEGAVRYMGETLSGISDMRAASELAIVMQDTEAQLVTDTVWHELVFSMESLGFSQEEMQGRIGELTASFGLETLLERRIDTLSGGQKQLVALVAALTLYPKVILLDEPCANLDTIGTDNFLHILDRVHKEFGITVIMAEQRLTDVLSLADHVICMENGEVLFACETADVANRLSGNPLYAMLPLACRLLKTPPFSVKCGRDYLRKQGIHVAGEAERYPVAADKEKTQITDKQTEVELLKHVWYRYEKDGTWQVKDTTLTLGQGTITAILGANGAGKTTLLKLAAGILKPVKGKRLFDASVSYLPQDAHLLFTEDTVEAEFKNADKEKLLPLLDRFQLHAVLKQHPYDLSGGELKRAALTKLIIKEPKLLLLDEPANGLDCFAKKELAGLLQTLAAQGTTILMVSHDIEFCTCADYCGLCFDGQLMKLTDMRSFFLSQHFYTTTARRMTSGFGVGIVTEADLAGYYDVF